MINDFKIKVNNGENINYIYHISDIHIRTGNNEQSRYNEYLYVFKNLKKTIKSNNDLKQSILIITGDIFHHKNLIESSGIELFSFLIKELTKLLPVFIIMGNHDYRQDNIDDTDLLSALINNSNYKNIYYLEKTGVYTINNLAIGVMAINDILLSGDTSGMIQNIPPFPNPNNVNSDYKIALYHGIIIDEDNEFFLKLNKGIKSDWFSNYDYVLLGDIHTQQVNNILDKSNKSDKLNDNIIDISDNNKINKDLPVWGYSGSLIQQNFSESILKHGYLKWDLLNKKIYIQNIPNFNSFITFNSKNNTKNSEFFYDIQHFKSFLNSNNHIKNINLRFLSKNNKKYIIDIENLLDKLNIKYNSYFYNNNLNKINNDNDTEDNKVYDITSYNTPTNWYEFIETNINKEIIGDFDWKNLLNNPENMQINIDDIPDILKKKAEDKNKKIISSLSKYINSIESTSKVSNVLKLKYMEWNWILCYKNDNWFNFENMNNNVGLLNARNGYGKSSFLEIVCLALFGEPIPSRSNKNISASIICQQKPKNTTSKLKLLFSLDNNNYIIKRSFYYQNNDNKKLSMKEIELYNINEGNLVKLKSGSKAVKEWVNEHIGDIDSFLLSSMLTQNSDKDFFSMKINDQINLLDKALSLDSINVFVELLKITNLAYNNIIDSLEVQEMEILSNCNNNNISQSKVDEYKDTINNTKNELKNIQQSIFDKINHINKYINIDDNDDKIKEDINKNKEEINNKINEIKINKIDLDIKEIYNNYGQIKNKIEYSEKEFFKYKINTKKIDNASSWIGNYNCSDILWKLFDIYIGENRKGYQKKFNFKETPFDLSLDSIISSLSSCNKFFSSNSQPISIDHNKQDIDNIISDLEKNKEDINNEIKKSYKKLNKIEKSSFTIEQINNLKSEFNDMKKNINKKTKLLNTKNELIEFINNSKDNYDEYENKKYKINTIIEDIKSKDYPFNPDCECCKKQPWKLQLNNLESELKEIENSQNSIINDIENKKIKFKNIQKKLIKLNNDKKELQDYIDKYNQYEKNSIIWDENIELIEKYEKILKKIEKNESKLPEITKEIKDNTNILNKLIKIDEYNNWKLKEEHNKENILKYFEYSIYLYDEYKKNKNELTKIESNINKIENNKKLEDEKKYWKNILIIKPFWCEYQELKNSLEVKTNYLNIISNKYITLKKDLINHNKNINKSIVIKNNINKLKRLSKIYEHFMNIFGNFRNWLYKNKIIPLIIDNTNDIISKISSDDNDKLKIDVIWNENNTYNWIINDGKNKPNIEKASGFQRFIIGLSIKITLSNLGVSNLQNKQLFIDEGFTSCDKEHLNKVPMFINSLLSLYDSILVVSHLQQIKESVSIIMNINRDLENRLSYINYGNKIDISNTKINI